MIFLGKSNLSLLKSSSGRLIAPVYQGSFGRSDISLAYLRDLVCFRSLMTALQPCIQQFCHILRPDISLMTTLCGLTMLHDFMLHDFVLHDFVLHDFIP